MPTLLFCYDLNSDRPARPRVSALYIVTKLSLLMCCTPVTLIKTLLTGVEHQVEVGDKYDLKLQIKNRETFTNKEQRNFTQFYLEIIFLRMTKNKIGNRINWNL